MEISRKLSALEGNPLNEENNSENIDAGEVQTSIKEPIIDNSLAFAMIGNFLEEAKKEEEDNKTEKVTIGLSEEAKA